MVLAAHLQCEAEFADSPSYIDSAGVDVVKGSGNQPVPEGAHYHSKLDAMRDPHPAFDGLRLSFFLPSMSSIIQVASSIYDLFEDDAIVRIADQLTEFDQGIDSHVVQPRSYINNVLPAYFHTIETSAQYQFSTEELIVIAELCHANVITTWRENDAYVIQDYH